jgi:hypothetical protein
MVLTRGQLDRPIQLILHGLTVDLTSMPNARFQTAVAMEGREASQRTNPSRGWRVLVSKRDLKLPRQL